MRWLLLTVLVLAGCESHCDFEAEKSARLSASSQNCGTISASADRAAAEACAAQRFQLGKPYHLQVDSLVGIDQTEVRELQFRNDAGEQRTLAYQPGVSGGAERLDLLIHADCSVRTEGERQWVYCAKTTHSVLLCGPE